MRRCIVGRARNDVFVNAGGLVVGFRCPERQAMSLGTEPIIDHRVFGISPNRTQPIGAEVDFQRRSNAGYDGAFGGQEFPSPDRHRVRPNHAPTRGFAQR